jgi:DNA-3-methyladenine glycosylase II
MWFEQSEGKHKWATAVRHLRRVDPVMKSIITRVGPCTLEPRKDYFVVLCKSIFSQQLNTKVAATLFGRFCDLFPRRRPTPELVVKALSGDVDDAVIRHVGLSRQKRAYVLDLARHFVDGEIPTRSFAGMEDEEIIEHLTRVNGIGRWTAEMFLMFVLNREDILPVDDLGLVESMRVHYSRPDRPGKKEAIVLAERWRPYRTIATWYLWRGNVPAEKKARQPEQSA